MTTRYKRTRGPWGFTWRELLVNTLLVLVLYVALYGLVE